MLNVYEADIVTVMVFGERRERPFLSLDKFAELRVFLEMAFGLCNGDEGGVSDRAYGVAGGSWRSGGLVVQ